MKNLKEINQEFDNTFKVGIDISNQSRNLIKQFWNSAIKQILEDVKPKHPRIIKRNDSYDEGWIDGNNETMEKLDSNIKNILEG